jgi:hypothetical protein
MKGGTDEKGFNSVIVGSSDVFLSCAWAVGAGNKCLTQ